LASEEKADKVRQASLERELEWIRMSPRARQSKGKARLNAFSELVAESEAAERRGDKLEIAIPPGPRLGDVVVNAQQLTKGFDERLLMEDLTFLLPPGGIVGIIGANGAGKTTLFKMMVGQEQPDSGTIDIGSTVSFAYVDQSRDDLNAENTVFDEISEGQERMVVGNREIHARAYVASFGFKGSDQQKRVGEISGGERNRVQLAKVLRSGGNVLLLDEPTNDLDVDTLRALEDGLLSFPGCVVVISHDRWFLDRISTHVLAFEGDAQVRWFEGNFSDYEAERHKRLGTDADQPHRMHYKPISRS
jgi:ATPase subunit of ABC transporter with duplicated ATPase domains